MRAFPCTVPTLLSACIFGGQADDIAAHLDGHHVEIAGNARDGVVWLAVQDLVARHETVDPVSVTSAVGTEWIRSYLLELAAETSPYALTMEGIAVRAASIRRFYLQARTPRVTVEALRKAAAAGIQCAIERLAARDKSIAERRRTIEVAA